MLKTYFFIALRLLRKQKGYAFINGAGLAIGMACCMLIFIYVHHELSYDRFHEHADRLYRVALEWHTPSHVRSVPLSPAPMAETVTREYPQVVSATRFYARPGRIVAYEDKQFLEEGILHADARFLEVFSFPLLQGDPRTALQAPNAVVLTKATAEKYFGSSDPMGKTLFIENVNLRGRQAYTVTGIADHVPSNSHFHFNLLLSFTTLTEADPEEFQSWTFIGFFYTYVLLQEGADPEELEAEFPAMIRTYAGAEMAAGGASYEAWRAAGNDYHFFLQPITDLHLFSKLDHELAPGGDRTYVLLLGVIALFILILACVNFINLATARSTVRAREIGIRKVVGASVPGIVALLSKDFLKLVAVAFVAATPLAYLAMERWLDGFAYRIDVGVGVFVVAGALALAIALLTVSYQSIKAARADPVTSLRYE